MHDGLIAALEAIEADAACRAVLLTGAGRGFCGGQDLADRAVAPGGPAHDLGQHDRGLSRSAPLALADFISYALAYETKVFASTRAPRSSQR
jgi:enoyl-CoA hydratase/carnithine racemase